MSKLGHWWLKRKQKSRLAKREARRADPANAAIQQEIIDAAAAKRARRALRPIPPTAVRS